MSWILFVSWCQNNFPRLKYQQEYDEMSQHMFSVLKPHHISRHNAVSVTLKDLGNYIIS